MQPANAGYHPYQFPYYSPPVPHDHELKKQYLALLPPQQIIEICLTFEIHVPPYVKSTVWPLDINAAIVALRKATPTHGESSPKPDVHPAMGSLNNTAEVSPSDEPVKKPDEPQPPDKSASNASEPQSVNRQTSTSQPPYPHQPYGFQQPQSSYPHAAYYGHPPAGFPPYPSYPYQPFPPHHPPPPPPASQSITSAPLHHPHAPQPQDSFREQPSADDLPSYEEMIVEALTECGDSEGCPPKELFTWMASRYPLQSNFRPSASQALQKAFKRGRFEKSRGGKYRLNATWEGGNTSRRTTRRPQTHTRNQAIASTNLAPQSSPFTHAPLVHHPKFSPSPSALPQPQPQPHQPSPFGLPYPPLPGYPAQPPSSAAEAQFLHINVDTDDATPANAYEAAQHILQAINFGELLKMSNEEDKPSVCTNLETPPIAPPILVTAPPSMMDAPGVHHRAELQAMLALLAAQLAEVAHADEDDGVMVMDNELSVAVVGKTPPPPPPATLNIPDPGHQEEEEEDSDEDMEEVI